jgi:hypothetical protein
MNDLSHESPSYLTRPVGSNHVGMRQFNERIVLQAIRLHGALPKAEVARLTRLSTQTASVIINGLLDDELVIKQDRLRGKIGQPSIPIALNPDGAFTLGIKVGRRSLDVLAMDFVGQVRFREMLSYEYPDPDIIFPAIQHKLALVDKQLGQFTDRLVGVGVAAPLWLGGWRDFLGAPLGVMKAWDEIDIHSRIQAMTALPVEFAKDLRCRTRRGSRPAHPEFSLYLHRHVRRRRARDRQPPSFRHIGERWRGWLIAIAQRRWSKTIAVTAQGLRIRARTKPQATRPPRCRSAR